MKVYIHISLVFSFLICSFFLIACSKDQVKPKDDFTDLTYLINGYLAKGNNFKVYFYKFPAIDTSAYILRTNNNEVLVQDDKIKVRYPSYNFDLKQYNSMAIKYFTRNPNDTPRVERMDIYLDAK